MVEAIERVRGILSDVELDVFEADWQRRWLVERGVEIVSEASRHLTGELKARRPGIPWSKVAGIGNVCGITTRALRRRSSGSLFGKICRFSNKSVATSSPAESEREQRE